MVKTQKQNMIHMCAWTCMNYSTLVVWISQPSPGRIICTFLAIDWMWRLAVYSRIDIWCVTTKKWVNITDKVQKQNNTWFTNVCVCMRHSNFMMGKNTTILPKDFSICCKPHIRYENVCDEHVGSLQLEHWYSIFSVIQSMVPSQGRYNHNTSADSELQMYAEWWMQDWNIHNGDLHQCHKLLQQGISESKMYVVWT